MNYHFLWLLLLSLLSATLPNVAAADAEPTTASVNTQDAADIFDKSVQMGLVEHWGALASLTITKGKREKIRKGNVVNLKRTDSRDSMRIFRFDKPVDVSGIAFLIYENSTGNDDIWMYLPSMSKTRRILSSSKNDSFMGSDFSYADLMAARTADYTHQLVTDRDCNLQGEPCYIVHSTVKTKKVAKALGYSELVTYIYQDSFLPYKIEYIDKKGRLFKYQEIADFTPSTLESDLESTLGSTWVAKTRVMTNLKKKSVSTLTLEQIVTDTAYDNTLFTEKRLGKI